MIGWVIISGIGVSASWPDYLPLVVLVAGVPLAVWAIRKLWRALPENYQEVSDAPGEPPPEPEFELVQIASFMNDVDADTACMLLRSAGIPSYIRRDDCGGWRPWLRFATGGLRLVVRDTDAERAAAILKQAGE